MDPISFGLDKEDKGPKRKPNRKERRAQRVINRREHKKLIQRVEARAKRRFEVLKKAQEAADTPEVAEEYGF